MSDIEAPVPSAFSVKVKAAFAKAVAFVKAHPAVTVAAFVAVVVVFVIL